VIARAILAKSPDDFLPSLAIDRGDLDGCLTEQPETYYHVSQEFASAVAERDQTKLELEELQASLGQELRAIALREEEKLTETGLQQKLTAHPKIQDLQRVLLQKRKDADRWQALKESFSQRSFMLRELVALFIAQRHDLAIESGAGQARTVRELSESTRKEAGRLRRIKRGAASE